MDKELGNGVDVEARRKSSTGDSRRKNSTDGELLQQLGHVEELQRNFSVWSLGSLCLCLMATWEALGSVVALALISGGAPCLFYN